MLESTHIPNWKYSQDNYANVISTTHLEQFICITYWYQDIKFIHHVKQGMIFRDAK